MTRFEEAIKVHLKSIIDRDLPAFSVFLHHSENSLIILPNGDLIKGRDNILDFHKEWFKDTDWRMDAHIVDIFTTDDIGYALLDVVYHDIDEEGKPYELKYFLSLLFKQIDGKWFLLRDQNTLK